MMRIFPPLVVLAVVASAVPAAAQESTPSQEPSPSAAEPAAEAGSASSPESVSEADSRKQEAPSAPDSERSTDEPESAQTGSAPAVSEPAITPAAEPVEESDKFRTFVTGYFRAPLTLGISTRPGPDDANGAARSQVSYGPTRTVDANYYSFAYTRLQEQDWAELFFHAKKKHVEAVVGLMGYWFQSAGFRNYDAGWLPGMAYLTLDTDFELGGLRPNVALTVGAFWPAYGYFEKYDTYTLGRFRQLGEQLKLTVPISHELTVSLTQGFGTNRDGSFNILSPPPYQATVGLDLIHYEHLSVSYADYLDVGLHFNHQWTRDPNLTQRGSAGQAYTDAREAKFTTIGGEVNVRAPYAGRLWISPSFTRIRNGWALAQGGTEIMHSLGAAGFATNYMGWDESADNSTGTGSSFNLGFLYENSLSTVLGKQPSDVLPEVKASVFGLLIRSNLDLPDGSVISQDQIKQLKYGADVTVHPLSWLGVMLRWDEANYNLDDSGYVFSAITGRLIFSSHFLSSESIYLQYSRYRYGERMVIAGRWPWGQPLVAGSQITQGGPYAGDKPDMDVIKVQANVAF
jgi:hypothetical protein